MLFNIALIWLIVGVALITAHKYEGYKIYETIASNRHELKILHRLSEEPRYDFFKLTRILGDEVHVLVKPQDQYEFENILNDNEVEYNILADNVERNIAKDSRRKSFSRSSNNRGIDPLTFQRFHRLPDIYDYINRLAVEFPARVKVQTIGKSYEKRDIKSITISNGNAGKNKKVILIDAGTHAREWISYEAALYTIHQLVENNKKNAALLEKYDWIIVPVVNPDGFVMTYKKGGKRYWRKNKRPLNGSCYDGVDINRNFAFGWGQAGSTDDVCLQTYRGAAPQSEPETQAIQNLMLSLKGRAKMYVTLHSYGKMLLYPYSFKDELTKNSQLLDKVGKAGADAMHKFGGSKYLLGSTTRVLYFVPGSSIDYAYEMAGIPVCFTMEMKNNSFHPKLKEIKPFAQEAWLGIKAMAETVIKEFEEK